MNKFSNDKGITLISLIITIIVLLILAAIAIPTGRNTIEEARLTEYSMEMQMVQQKVNELEQQYRLNEEENSSILQSGQLYEELSGSVKEQADIAFNGANVSDKIGYRYYNASILKSLGLENLNQEFLVNVQKRMVISLNGINYKGNTYYTASQLPNGMYNVDYVAPE